jgi:serine/threonine protein kinase
MTDQPDAPSLTQAPIKELSGRIGKYEIIRPLGKGAMGIVYLAHDTVLERDVALKVMVSQIADDPELKQRFEREARAVAKMTHPNVVTVFDLGSHTDGSPFIAMELLKGTDLQRAVRQPPPLTLERKVSIIVQVLAGLAHAHQAGIVHRDIKPANIFINTEGTVKIMDFGVARLTTASMTGTGNIVGTADYMSPEQVKGSRVDGRSDVFSVGCMLYELLSNRRPFHSDNLMAIFYKITHEEPNFDVIPVGEEYDSLLPVLRKALAKDLEERYQTAYEFAVDLRGWLKDHATTPSSRHALETLVEMEAAPSSPPYPLTDGGGATVIPAEVGEVAGSGTKRVQSTRGRGTSTSPGAGATYVPGRAAPTVLAPGPASAVTTKPGTTRLGPAAPPTVFSPTRPEPRQAPAGGSPILYSTLGGMFVLLLGAGGFIYWKQNQVPPTTLPPSPVASVSSSMAPPPAVPLPTLPPPTTAPVVSGEAKPRGASLRLAQAQFNAGNYDRAVAAAQEVLREDPRNPEAQKLVENALSGQKAETHLGAAETALRQGGYDQASSEAEAAQGLAPWDGRIPGLMSRIRDAQLQAQQQQQRKAQQQVLTAVNGILAKADDALATQKYDTAINLYDEVLKADPQNQRATLGKTSAVGARALSQAAAQGVTHSALGRSFVAGKTVAQSAETRQGNAPEGFEESAGVTVKKGTQPADLPGKINFDFSPSVPKPGEKYTASISLVNEGLAPIQLRDMIVTTTVNGKRSQGPVPPLTKDVAPKQKALLLSLPDLWKEDITSWTMEIVVHTTRGETYKNQVTWK